MKLKNSIQQYFNKHGFRQFSPKAVLFDMDGVIYDSMPNHAVSWHESMAAFGLDMPLEGAYLYEGMRGVETIKLLARNQWQKELTDDEAARMYAAKSQRYATCPPARIMPGIRDVMQQIKDGGMKICVVTGSGQHVLLDKLQDDFPGLVTKELMVTAFDVTHGKPDPEPYLIGMRKCGVKPWQTIVVENAPLGVRAAAAAHCFTIAVNSGPLPDKVLWDEGADLVFPDMVSLSTQWASLMAMTPQKLTLSQKERWEQNYKELRDFIITRKQLPSKHRKEEHDMLNWMKYNRKCIAAGKLSAERIKKFQELMDMARPFLKVNQYAYAAKQQGKR